jgi:DNA-binding CsgD family transcriptional regulator
MRNGELEAAASLVEETEAALATTGSDGAQPLVLALAAHRGRQVDLGALLEAGAEDALGTGSGWAMTRWASALLYNGLGRYDDALSASCAAADRPDPLGTSARVLPELIEAAVRTGMTTAANDALRRLSAITRASGSDWALGIEARCRALLSDGDEAERLYHEAIDRLGRAGTRVELARAHLLYGEWLRRERRRTDAREQLRTADEMFTAMGVEAFAERAGRELRATGETARKRTLDSRDELTPQEAHVAGLARDGLSNPEIGARLFISPRTVEYHLRKVFAKLGIASRRELEQALAGDAREPQPA